MNDNAKKDALAAAAGAILPELAKAGLSKSKKAAGAALGVVGGGLAAWLLPEGASAAATNWAFFVGSLPGCLLLVSETCLDWRALAAGQARPRSPAKERAEP